MVRTMAGLDRGIVRRPLALVGPNVTDRADQARLGSG
jgi:hypothetical protein